MLEMPQICYFWLDDALFSSVVLCLGMGEESKVKAVFNGDGGGKAM